ncbi:hypothetical protein ISN44_As13g013830 [Arabidopsis suecica]|uniref:Uncharacterized protein n=1 Tax=Arabidopsis suecica TaxID=45249 RepID=A0A8T1XXH8_ARASU|nr:hypothetical protein ISN44_As13g013830 [Arabidopsis suecica]
MASWNRGKTFSGNILGPDVGFLVLEALYFELTCVICFRNTQDLSNSRGLFEDKMSRRLCQSSKSGVNIQTILEADKTIKDQNVVSGSTSKEPVKVSRFVPGAVKHHHRRAPLLFADYPKPSTRPPRHN